MVHGGRLATVNGISSLRQWTINDSQNLASAIHSGTNRGTQRFGGVEDWSGSIQCFDAQPDVMPGATLSFVGYTSPDNDVSGVGRRFSGTALCSQVQINWNWGAGEVISGQIDFAGHLALAVTEAGAAVTDAVTPQAKPIAGAKIQYSLNGTVWTDWPDVNNVQLIIKSALAQYTNSGCVISGRQWTGRLIGPIDWTCAITEDDTIRKSGVNKGDQVYLRLYVNATTFYELWYGRVESFSNITCDRQTGAIIQQTVNIAMSSNEATTGAIGKILLPDTTQYWP